MPKRKDEDKRGRGRPRKADETVRVHLRMAKDMYDAVATRAEEKETTVTGIIETAVEKELKRK